MSACDPKILTRLRQLQKFNKEAILVNFNKSFLSYANLMLSAFHFSSSHVLLPSDSGSQLKRKGHLPHTQKGKLDDTECHNIAYRNIEV